MSEYLKYVLLLKIVLLSVSCSENLSSQNGEVDLPSECADVTGEESGVYVIKPTAGGDPFEVYCDLTLAGQKWTVIQQRFNGEVDFYRNYSEYTEGFGNLTGSHWLGLDHINLISASGSHELYVDMEALDGTKAFASYNSFFVSNANRGYTLYISGYNGTAGESMNPYYGRNNLSGMKFSTYDNDQDKSPANCAEDRHGAWWYNDCSFSNLNGRYHDTYIPDHQSMYWFNNFMHYSLKTVRMLVRRK